MALPIDNLTAFGFSRAMVQAWKSRGLLELLPLQEKALSETSFLHGGNILTLAPTSSGKTFIAELAAARFLEKNQKVLYLTPTKALAEEKYRDFYGHFSPLGFRVAVSTRERHHADRTVLEGRYDLLVAVYEKMKSYMTLQPEMLRSVGLLIVDELQTLGESERGATLDVLLTKVQKSPYAPQLLGLSAVVGDDAPRVAQWLGAQMLHGRDRPVELREGVFNCADHRFEYRCFNTGQAGNEFFDSPMGQEVQALDEEAFRRGAILQLTRLLAEERGEQVLLFVPTRYISREWAQLLTEMIQLPPASQALEALEPYEDCWSREMLEQALRCGIAFHNSDLAWDLRELVEHHYSSGDIRVLISTSTLGQGVNLTGRNVLHVPAMVETDPWTGRHQFASLSRSRFHNQGGRGARFSREQEYGRSMLIARDAMEGERFIREYVEGALEPVTPQVDLDNLDSHVLDLIASKLAATQEELTIFFHDTFTGRLHWPVGGNIVQPRVSKTMDDLLERHMVEEEGGRFAVTGLGECAAVTGLHPASIEKIAQWLQKDPMPVDREPLECLLILASTRDGRDYGFSGKPPRNVSAWVEEARRRLFQPDKKLSPELEKALFPMGGFSRNVAQDLRKALALDGWMGAEETRYLEEQYQLFSGALANMASHFSWLAQAAAALARVLMMPDDWQKKLENLSHRLLLGCEEAGIGLRALRAPGLSRAYIQNLIREGFTTPESLDGVEEDTLAQWIPRPVARDLLAERSRNREQGKWDSQSEPESGSVESPAPKNEEPLGLLVDLRGGGRALYDGQDLNLSPLPFQMLCLLLKRGGSGMAYEEMEAELWPDTQVERQMIHHHRNRLIKALAQHVGTEKAKQFLPLIPRRGIRANFPPSMVRVVED